MKKFFSHPLKVSVNFLKLLLERGMDIRKIRPDFFGGSSKSIKALKERGFIASLCEDMPQAGAC